MHSGLNAAFGPKTDLKGRDLDGLRGRMRHDSGTDALTGLTGSMVITITDGQHSYKFEYALPD